MSRLRTRITALLIGAILAVVVLASFAAISVMQPPSPAATMEPIARQIHATLALVGRGGLALPALHDSPAGGMPDPGMSRFLRGALRHTGPAREAVVTRHPGGGALTASVRADGGRWLVTEIPDFAPPPGRWRIMVVWLSLIVLGSAAISIFAARMLTRPLQVLEGAADRIGPDGLLEHIPETGSAEVRAAARALNRLSAQLRRAMESRMRLVAAAGHDLRTPMTRMRLRAEFIEDEALRAKWLEDLHELDLIADSAIRLVREEVGAAGREPLRLDRMLADIAAEQRALGQQVDLAPMPELTVRGGPMALKRALRNLIANAATHGLGARVALESRDGRALVRIEDDGPGVPPELVDRILEPFFRVDPARRKAAPGAGLGLAIAREIIERHGGHIAIANRSPHGLSQVCDLPCAAP